MRKKNYILFISLLFPLMAFSQKDSATPYKWDIIAGGGIGLPEGSFLNNNSAYSGGTAFISATRKIKNSIYDLVCMMSYNSNNFNLEESLSNPNNGMGTTYEDAISYGSYREFNTMVGLAICTPKNSSGFSFNIRLMSGVGYTYTPRETYYTITYTYPTPTKDYVNINASNTVGVPLDFGIDFKIPLPKKLLFSLGFDFSTPGVINYTAGIGYRFY
jgi:hypothetical protein